MTSEEKWLQQKESALGWLRLGFSLTAFLVVLCNPQWAGRWPFLFHLSLTSFFIYSLAVLYLLRAQRPVSKRIGFVTTSLDLFWISLLIVLSAGSTQVPTFALCIFPVITASSRYGIKGSLSVALIEATLYGFVVFSPFLARPISADTFVIFNIYLFTVSYILGCLFDLEMKQIQKLMSLSISTAMVATQQERRRIARELHDRVLQVMGSLTLRLETCRNYLAGFPTLRLEACRKCLVGAPNLMLEACRKCLVGAPKELETELTLSEEETRSSMKEIRSILAGRVMDGLPAGTLLEKLREETELLHDRFGLRVVLDATPEHFELAQEVEQEIYYTVREGLTNIARHSRASEASLSLKQTNGALRVSLEDNGLGFEPTPTDEPGSGLPNGLKGYGLQGMRERVGKLGGDFSVKTALGKGTQISFVVPAFPIPIEPELKETALDQLGETPKQGFFGWSYLPHGLAAAFALLLIVAAPYLFWQGKVQENIFTDTITQYQRVIEGTIDNSRAASSVPTPARLLDLRPWGYSILSWQTQMVNRREGRLFVYQGRRKEYLLAQEFEGAEFLPPPGGSVIRSANGDFVSYNQQGVNLVAWKQKDLLCIFASTLPKEKLLGLAQQVAMSG